MKKLLILVDSKGPKKEKFVNLISQRLNNNVKVVKAYFSDLTVEIDGKNISVTIDNEDIRTFDLVYFRRVGNRFFSLAGTLAICLNQLKIPFFDTTFAEVGPDEDKLTNLTRLVLVGLPIIPTFFCWHTKIDEYKDYIIKKFGLPLVAKWLASHRGLGVSLIRSAKDFDLLQKEGESKNFLFQKYLENDEEYRLLVLKNEVAVTEEKIRTDPNEFRSNVALGAREEFINVDKIPQAMKDIAVMGAQTLKIQTAGVDILVDKSGKTWLLEINRGPGLTYDTKISPEIDKISDFFKRELGIK
ncbi:hypothetical protein A2210_02605 [Candidatus Woesebacteria bacterium RIFOXYA1_FULL_40_18]|uniref:ATP-grasp domain-containing protein n=3 Tax=Candidatus Woeseibacteriota TaxID=1752722 RepID=A0A1F8CJX2_9BACT|nr:MAG: hypothetical protein A2210_02605 [Candidatus Woesebacteria bacterium RIFOXYA1_FULL_40_18]OGM80490.1 MAG: hypothetical protein A2361_01885 [Candidatus Woesebacteria bacterium RIFOXYB1_FULL_40_26]OGM87470.1 MAG: hypothetical protein A2614_02585 [Candidatus Woesebacteria bacterium RIFOXYD1_FULL_40_21]